MSRTTTWTCRWATASANQPDRIQHQRGDAAAELRGAQHARLDVDEEQGEVDLVYLNGHLLGKLTGANNVWSVTAFNVNPAWLVAGQNLVRIDVDTSGDATAWVTTIDWAQLLIDGGGATDGDTQSVQITGTSVDAEQRHDQYIDFGALDHRWQLPAADQPHRSDRQCGHGAHTGLRGRRGRGRDAHGEPGLSAVEHLGHVHHPGAAVLARSGAGQFPRAAGHRDRAVHAHRGRGREQLQQRQRRRRVARQPGNGAGHRPERCGHRQRRRSDGAEVGPNPAAPWTPMATASSMRWSRRSSTPTATA